ncbi:hypothetical protein [Salinivibrio kushneri]|uniref:hypothetical protein n=1 Tax=Salinivibrio kushneri TaxID=1908198 RepID=UPI0018E3E774|nr:hypothetical protein [Salinivibrio kushneri]
MNVLTAIYRQREPGCQQTHEQANRTCARGDDAASRYLHQYCEAYPFHGDSAAV